MPTSGSPTVRRRLLAAHLRRLRADTGKTADEVGKALGWSKAKISRYELAQGGLKPGGKAGNGRGPQAKWLVGIRFRRPDRRASGVDRRGGRGCAEPRVADK